MVKSRKEIQKFKASNRIRVNKRNIKGFTGISKELDSVYNDFNKGLIDEGKARTLTYILRTKSLCERDRYLDEFEQRLLDTIKKVQDDKEEF